MFAVVMFLVTFQATMGTFFFPYMNEIAQEASISIANFALWGLVLLISLLTQTLFN